MDETKKVTVYGYRWVVLAVFAFINLIVQLQWLTFAPVEQIAKGIYHVTTLQIDLLSLIFMLLFVLFSIPASYIIDTYGLRVGVGIGAVLVGLSALLKGFYADSYTMVFVSQVGLSIAQPFVMNATTKVSVRWFPLKERATAAGIVSLAMFIGIVIVMILTPILVTSIGNNTDLKGTFLIYGLISAASAILTVVFLREQPATPPSLSGRDERFRVGEGLKHIFRERSMVILIILFFIAIGMFNAITTVIDQIGALKGLTTDQTGLVGGLIVIGAIVGAGIFPIISDRMRRRKPFIVIAMIGALPGLAGIAIFTSYTLLLVSAFILGFFVVSAMPIGFQYSAEISYPAPESSSQGLTLLAGNLSGVIFIFLMDGLGVAPFLVVFIVLFALCVLLATQMKESPMILTEPVES